jgi:curved DNA-binding protein
MVFKDFYSILGLQPTASSLQIKHAFYKLALKYHPDKNPLDPTSSDKFKEISEANKVLSDPEKRKKYDKLFIQIKNAQFSKKREYESYLAQKRKTYQHQSNYSTSTKTDTIHKKNRSFSEFIDAFIFTKFTSKINCRSNNVNDIPYRTTLHISLVDALQGAILSLIVGNKKVPVKITPGIANGKEIVYRAFFSDSYPSSRRNLIIRIVIDKHSIFKRFNQNLICDLEIDLYTAILGGIKEIRTLDNKLLRLRIPESTNSGTLLRLKGLGLPFPSNTCLRGDLFIKINVHIPENLSGYEHKLFEQLSILRKTVHS